MDVELTGVHGNIVLHDWQDRERPACLREDRLRLTLTPWPQYVYGLERGGEITVGPGTSRR